MSVARLLVVCWAIVLIFVCCCSSAARGFSYTLYSDSACTQPISQGSYSDPTLSYSRTSICLTNVTSSPSHPAGSSSAAYYANPLGLRGTPNITLSFFLFSGADCRTGFIQGIQDQVQNLGVPQGICTQLQLVGNASITYVWANISVGAPPFPNSAHAAVFSWTTLVTVAALLATLVILAM